ncbi:uncharacterized protein LOC131643247 [Vicia villosa]|uniref:uncharacterized protein LOC131643247 n=1 Tax=Vicia villosa TaxID=3911 RepID=UPI00273A8A4E|nr:uncharacterized protein LOC131643247 [Vicia villosa]
MVTRLKFDEMQNIVSKTGFKNMFPIDCRGSSKGRAGEDNNPWAFLGLYGFSEEHRKRNTRQLVQDVCRELGDCLIILGNFNDVVKDCEKVGGIGELYLNSLGAGMQLNNVAYRILVLLVTLSLGRMADRGMKISNVWRANGNTFTHKTKVIQELSSLFKEYRSGSVEKEIRKLESLLKEERRSVTNVEEIQKFKTLERQRGKLLGIEETLWRQRSRATWLMDEDRNTKFFHNKANQQRKTNTIKRLKDKNGI